jgi:hypothetical protein
MKKLAKYLRAIIATGSVLGFLGGWVLIAHAGKPAPAPAPLPIVAPAPTLAPLPSFGAPSSLQPLPALPQISSMPRLRLRTGGS